MKNGTNRGRLPASMRLHAPSYLVAFLIALFSLCTVAGAEGEAESFKTAVAAFRDKFYERAEEQLGTFTTSFANSTNVPQAILLRAQARYFQRNYDGAIELLKANSGKAGAISLESVSTSLA